MNKSKNKIFAGAIGVLIVLGIVIALNVVVGSLRVRKDLTEEKLYSLSSGTKTLLKDLDRPVTLKFFFSKSNKSLPIQLKNYATRIEDLLNEYKLNGGRDIIIETYDPRPDSDEEEWAQKYGLSGQSLGMFSGMDAIYIGLVAVSGKKEAAIPFMAPEMEPQLEYLITRLIAEVTTTEKPILGVMSPLPVLQVAANPYMRQAQVEPVPGWATINELKKQYEVRSVSTDVESIPSDIKTLILIHPKELSKQTLFAIDQFVLKGGRLMAFVDPLCESDIPPANNQMGFSMPSSSQINDLTKAWGIEMVPSEVVSDLEAASPVTYQNGQQERLTTWLSLRGDLVDRDDIATASLDLVQMIFSGALKGDPSEGLEKTVLLHSSDDSYLVNSFAARSPGADKHRNASTVKQAPLAVRLQGTFKTAFPDGKPPKADAEGNEASTDNAQNWLTESEKDGVVVLVSDVDMLADRFTVQAIPFFGQQIYQPRNANMALLQNLVEQLSGNEALIGLRSRGTFQRPFDRVIAMEKEAQQRWQEEEIKLKEKLQEAQSRLNQLQAQKSEDQKYIMTPEQQAEIKKFREQRFETQRQLKDVRKKLRENIENLGLKLKVINIAGIPVLVAIFGIVHGLRRRAKGS